MNRSIVQRRSAPILAGLELLENPASTGRRRMFFALVLVLGLAGCSSDSLEVERTFSTSRSSLENSCEDAIDDDNDGFVDCADPDCAGIGPCAKAFTCQPGLFQTSFNDLIRVDSSQNPFGQIPLGTLSSTVSGDINARDGFGYAMKRLPPYDIIRVFQDGSEEIVSVSPAINQDANIGVMDLDNNLWIMDSLILTAFRVNIVSGVVDSFALDRAPRPTDFAFNVNDGRMYGLAGSGRLFVLDPTGTTPTLTRQDQIVTSSDPRFGACNAFGAQAFDSSGVLFAFCNPDGLIWAVDIENFTATYVGPGAPAANNEGFSCALARSSFEVCGNGRDDDGDGVVDEDGAIDPDETCVDYPDTDNDGQVDIDDIDDDNDGVLDSQESGDADGDGLPDRIDLDSDNDGIFDLIEAGHGAADLDNDGRVDGGVGFNGFLDDLETSDDEDSGANYAPNDADGDQIPSLRDLDSDDDGVFDSIEVGFGSAGLGLDADDNGIIDDGEAGAFADADLDGLPDSFDQDNSVFGSPSSNPLDTDDDGNQESNDSDDDGIPDPYDADDAGPGAGDSDSDGIPDDAECPGGWPCPDANADGVPDYADPDLDDDGTDDGSDEDPLDPCVSGTTDAACDPDGDGTGGDSDPDNADPCVPSVAVAVCDEDQDGSAGNVDPDNTDPCVPDTAAGACEQGGGADGDDDPGDAINPDDTDPCDSDPASPSCNPDRDDDGDGLSNAEEDALGTDPNNTDTDGDGFSDNFELENGGDPTSSVVVAGGGFSGCTGGGAAPLWSLLVAIAPMLFRRRRRDRRLPSAIN